MEAQINKEIAFNITMPLSSEATVLSAAQLLWGSAKTAVGVSYCIFTRLTTVSNTIKTREAISEEIVVCVLAVERLMLNWIAG